MNTKVYGAAWAWLPTPLWLTLVDPESDGTELECLAREWSVRPFKGDGHAARRTRQLTDSSQRSRTGLPVLGQKS
jgi:hypothetical protein